MIRLAAWVLALMALPAQAASWEFSGALDVSPEQPGVFHQLDSSGRKHIAVSGDAVVIVWEESRAGATRVNAAFKLLSQKVFNVVRVGHGSAPVVVSLGGGRFVLAWEQDGEVLVRVAEPAALGSPLRLAQKAMQPSLAVLGDDVVVVWSEEVDHHPRIRFAHLKREGQSIRLVGIARDVDGTPPKAEQLYPDVALTPAGMTVAWEDRRAGHTILLHAFSKDGKRFSKPQIFNEQPPKRSEIYGKGTGVARVALVRRGARGVAAVWLDKRSFLEGYDVYAGFARDGVRFGKNEKVQDEFGNNISQWHAAVAADTAGRVAVAWDDDRDGSADLWLAWPKAAGQWSENVAMSVASGSGQQSSPAIVFDAAGNLHLAWTERDTPETPTRLRYTVGKFLK